MLHKFMYIFWVDLYEWALDIWYIFIHPPPPIQDFKLGVARVAQMDMDWKKRGGGGGGG